MYYEIEQKTNPQNRTILFSVTITAAGQEIDEVFNAQECLLRGIGAACSAGFNSALDSLWGEHEDFTCIRQRHYYSNNVSLEVHLCPSSRRRIKSNSTKQEADLVFFKLVNILGDISQNLEDFLSAEVTAALPTIHKKIERRRWDDNHLFSQVTAWANREQDRLQEEFGLKAKLDAIAEEYRAFAEARRADFEKQCLTSDYLKGDCGLSPEQILVVSQKCFERISSMHDRFFSGDVINYKELQNV